MTEFLVMLEADFVVTEAQSVPTHRGVRERGAVRKRNIFSGNYSGAINIVAKNRRWIHGGVAEIGGGFSRWVWRAGAVKHGACFCKGARRIGKDGESPPGWWRRIGRGRTIGKSRERKDTSKI